MECGQPVTNPLWLNSQCPSVNGAHAVLTTGMPTVADRTAANTAPDSVATASARNELSVHSGWSCR